LAQQVLESKTSPQVRSRALLLLANCDNEQGNIESAKQHVSSALLADPNSSEAKALLIQLDQRTLEDFKA
jgi:Tfp pilus assembly protein PilF